MTELISDFALFIHLAAELAKLALYVSGAWMCIKWIKSN
ncbi:hypothetical protein BvCms16BK_04761 [Escherichia coli]|nr:hypothetical protein BvCms16BK_04761 [Escherichia coli]